MEVMTRIYTLSKPLRTSRIVRYGELKNGPHGDQMKRLETSASNTQSKRFLNISNNNNINMNDHLLIGNHIPWLPPGIANPFLHRTSPHWDIPYLVHILVPFRQGKISLSRSIGNDGTHTNSNTNIKDHLLIATHI